MTDKKSIGNIKKSLKEYRKNIKNKNNSKQVLFTNNKKTEFKNRYRRRFLAASIVTIFLVPQVIFADIAVDLSELYDSIAGIENIYKFELNYLDLDKNAVTIDINKEIDMAGIKVNFKKLVAVPSEMRLYYEYDETNFYKNVFGGQEVESMRFSFGDLIIDGNKYSGLYGKEKSEKVKSEDNSKAKYIVKGFHAFNPTESLDNLSNIQNINLKIEGIDKEVSADISIYLKKDAKACYTDENGKKHNISIESIEIKDDNLIVQYKPEKMYLGSVGILDGDNVYLDMGDKRISELDIGNDIPTYELTFPKPSKLADLKLIISSVEVALQEDLDVKLK